MPDLFLSYAHVDKHWVDIFAPLLEQRVNQYAGRTQPDRLWKDNRLSGHQSFSPEIHAQLEQAQCLVACLSPGYLHSTWCLRELTEFSQRVGADSGRIFCIELDPLPLSQKPEMLLPILGYRFWREDALSKRTYPLHPGELAYETTLTDLGKDIAQQLRTPASATMTALGQGKPEAVSPAPSPVPNTRQARLQAQLDRLLEQYDLETRIEEKMRMERIIADKQKSLSNLSSS